ncbi:MAG: lasso peptide biosynthesis B2 protein [Actinobacteria bacterium]|nr:lasso peptide biosynthesis B2 protein [Actinomycetota bacterium]
MSERSASASVRSLPAKARLAGRIWWLYRAMARRAVREPLPGLVASLAEGRPPAGRRLDPRALGVAVHRVLGSGPRAPTCLVQSLVLFRLLREQGDEPVLVIGLVERPEDQAAHAWVEIGGVDVGPPPGSRGHDAMARFP